MFRVTMSFGGKPLKKYTFEKEQIAIGRDATCDIVIENIGASRRHAVIEKTPEGYVLSDLQSHNGTYVNGEKVFHHVLQDNQEFFIGKYAFQFEALEPVVAVAPDAPLQQSAPARTEMPDMTFRLDRREIERIVGLSARGADSQVVQIAPEREKQTLILDKEYAFIGADSGCALRAPGFLAAAKAALLLRTEQGWRLVGISRKFKVNGKPADDVPLQDGDLLELGSRRYRFCQG